MFKVGEKVVCVDDKAFMGGLTEGQEYIVEGCFVSGDLLPYRDGSRRWLYPGPDVAVWVLGGADFASGSIRGRDGRISPGYKADRFRKVERKSDSLSIEAFLTIKPNQFEGPKRTNQPAKRKEQA